MGNLTQILGVLGALVVLAGVAGGLWAVARSSAQDTRIKTLSAQRDDYLSRLNYIEPKLAKVEEQNRILLALHNPAEQIRKLGEQEQLNNEHMIRLLEEQRVTLSQIEARLNRGPQ